MRGARHLVAVAALVVAAAVPQAHAGIETLEAPDLRLVYFDPPQTYLAPHAARCFLNSMRFQRELWDYQPWEPVTVYLSDLSDQGNASASNTPRNTLIVDIAPLSLAYETVTPNERMNWIMNHELVHIATGDRAAKRDRFFRRFFQGKVAPDPDHPETILYFYLTTPRYAVPQWYREGIAVFVETWMAGGYGRAQGPWDEMVFRAKVRDDTRFYDPVGLASEGVKADFQAGVNYYLYGTRFMSYLAYEYSPEKVIDWVSRRDGSQAYYTRQFRAVFDTSLREAWRSWVDWEHRFQQANLDAIREFPLTPSVDVTNRAFGSVSRAFVSEDGERLYAAFNYTGTVPYVGVISTADGSVERLDDVKGPTLYTVTSLAHDPATDRLFFTSDNVARRDVRVIEPGHKGSRVVLRDARIGDLAFDRADDSLWGVRHLQGIATLVRIPAPYDDWSQVHSWPYGEVIHDLDVSPDGRLLSLTVDAIDGSHTLRVFEVERLLAGEVEPVAELDFGNTIPSNFVFADDGRTLYGTSYYTGVSNVFSFDVETQTFEALTNSETGLFRPIPQSDGSIVAFRYTGDGFVPTRIESPQPLEDLNAITYLGERIADRHPVVREWGVGSPAEIPLEELITHEGPYRSWKTIGLESIYPVVEGYKDFAAWGMALNLSDPLSFNRFTATATYTTNSGLPSGEKLHLDLDYRRFGFRAGASLNDADFYDLFGPTKRSRKGHVVDVGWERALIDDSPRHLDLDIGASYYGDLDTLPRYQNVEVDIDKLTEAGARLTWSNRTFSLGAVDHEKGIRAEAIAAATRVEGDVIPQTILSLDLGTPLPLDNSSVWWRTAAGASFGEVDDPFANFFFGGFGNNYVDFRSTKRYREWYAFPGLELNEAAGRNFVKSTLEWNLPPWRFRSAGTPGFFLSWARTSLFVSGLGTNLDDDLLETRYATAGAQMDFRLTVLARLNLTFSLGYARAHERGGDDSDEFMWSLKILD